MLLEHLSIKKKKSINEGRISQRVIMTRKKKINKASVNAESSLKIFWLKRQKL